MHRIIGIAAVFTLFAAGSVEGQSLARQVAAVDEGTVRMSFAARPGICGNGTNIVMSRNTAEWEGSCEGGPVRVALSINGRTVTDIRSYVGGRWRAADGETTNLGQVSAPEAADFLLALAARADGPAGEDAIVPAALADSTTVWPALLDIAQSESVPRETRERAVFWASQSGAPVSELVRLYDRESDPKVRKQVIFALSQRREPAAMDKVVSIARSESQPELREKGIFWLSRSDDPRAVQVLLDIARDESAPREPRKTAVFWLGQMAADAATEGLTSVVEDESGDLAVREHAIFALSRQAPGESIPALIRIARENPSPQLRKKAIFWLGQSEDPRAVALFEDLLTNP